MSSSARLHSSTDPTATKTLREREFRPALTRRFDALRSAVRTTVGYENDALQLKRGARPSTEADADDVDPAERFTFTSDAQLADAFMDWLDEQIDSGVLEPAPRRQIRRGTHYTGRYIRSAADRGWEDAAQRLRNEGVSVDADDLEQTFSRGVPQQQLEALYTRTFDNVETVTRAMRTDVRRELTNGLAQGWNPRKMARSLTDRVDAIGRTRAETLARTEVIHSYNESALTRYEQAGVSEVMAHVELLTAGDRRVCDRCKALEGRRFEIADARGMLPIHPSGRCAWIPSIAS